MRVSAAGRTLVKAWEGLKDGNPKTALLDPYICPANVYTVGWGHALTTPDGKLIDIDVFGPARAKQLAAEAMQRMFGAEAITMQQAEDLLSKDLDAFGTKVERLIGAGNATQAQFDALVSCAFNIGVGAFDGSSIKRLHVAGARKVGDVSISALRTASVNKHAPNTLPIAFVRWVNSQGRWTLGLFKRRVSELLVYAGHDVNVAISTARAIK